ncbi:MAG: MATE family efflux transporter [Propionicimonas sp.]|uniref:MATE family efflux transporter n=1 Tax=Propionicimonas sp. TaxID=1955623 RepID=UPI002B1F2D2E|nr:MATE family efflux transporter [Propionicimonas sp.]MEA4944434.1 MATE family efflux transporter [Propionicimonas sp.]
MIKNLTVGPPTRLIVLFALPLLIGNVFQQLYAFTDAAVVGRMLGVDALASVGAAGSLQFLLLGFTFGASGGMAIPVARAFGAGDLSGMRRYVAAGVMIAGGIAVMVTMIGVFFARPLLQLLDTPHTLIGNSTAFLAITFSGAAVTMAYNFLAATIRALGDSRTPLIFLIIACVLNAGLVVLFIGAFHLGVGGAALATVVAQAVSVIACLVLIVKRMPALRLRRADFQLRDGEFAEVARMGLTMGFQMSVIAVGALVLQYAINGLGTEGVAAATAAMRVDQFATQPLASFGLAMATFVAQNRGAGQWLRIRTGVFRISLVTWGVALLLGVGVILGGTPLVRLFIGDGDDHVVALAHQYLMISGSLYVILASLFVLRNTIQGLGSTSVPTIAGAMELVLRAVAGLVLVAHFGFVGVCLAGPLAWLGGLAPVAIAWFRKRRELVDGRLTDDRIEQELPALAAA